MHRLDPKIMGRFACAAILALHPPGARIGTTRGHSPTSDAPGLGTPGRRARATAW